MLASRAAYPEVDARSLQVRALSPLQDVTVEIRSAVALLNSCSSASDLCGWMIRFARSLGFYGARYVHIGRPWRDFGADDIQPPRRYLTTSPREEDVVEWLACDPCVDHARTAFAPFGWSTRIHGHLTARQRAWLEGEAARGVSAGLAVPVQDSAEGPAYLSLFGKGEGAVASLVAEHAPELAFAGAQFHALAKRSIPVTQWVPDLSTREIECLRLAALGRTIAESGETLGLSSRTIEYHLGNASRKLGAECKLRAVVLALGNGLSQI